MMEIGPRYTKPLNQSHRRKVFMSIGGGSLESRYKWTLIDQHEVLHIMYQMLLTETETTMDVEANGNGSKDSPYSKHNGKAYLVAAITS